MKNLQWPIRFAYTFVFLLMYSFAAQAQTRTFVSGLGSDANPCTRISPCRSFQRAHDVVNVGGEVIAVDSAGYGPVVITKSVTILGDGVYAGINTSSGDGVTIATPGITVNLRWLIIEGLGTGTYGINATDFAVLHVENCIVNSFGQSGIYVEPSSAGTRKVFIKDSISRNNAIHGISLDNGDGTGLIVALEGTRTEKNGVHGIVGRLSGVIVTAYNCESSGNFGNGFMSADGALLNIEKSVASNNGNNGIGSDGAIVASGVTVRVSNSTATHNIFFGFSNNNGVFESRLNNTVGGNNGGEPYVQISGTISPISGT